MTDYVQFITIHLSHTVHASPEDISFWLKRFTEHALFAAKLLNPEIVPELKQEMETLYFALEDETNKGTYNANLLSLLYALLFKILNRADVLHNINLELSQKDFHDLINHMLLEQTYFTRLVNDRVTVKEDLTFWVQESAEHLTLIASMLPKSNIKNNVTKLTNAIDQIMLRGHKDPAHLVSIVTLLRNEIPVTNEIYTLAFQHRLNINKEMLEHEMRETEYGLARIEYLVEHLVIE